MEGFTREFPATRYQEFVGKRIAAIEQASHGGEGLKLVFTDYSWLEIVFCGGEGEIRCDHAECQP